MFARFSVAAIVALFVASAQAANLASDFASIEAGDCGGVAGSTALKDIDGIAGTPAERDRHCRNACREEPLCTATWLSVVGGSNDLRCYMMQGGPWSTFAVARIDREFVCSSAERNCEDMPATYTGGGDIICNTYRGASGGTPAARRHRRHFAQRLLKNA